MSLQRDYILSIWLGACTETSPRSRAKLFSRFGHDMNKIYECEDYSDLKLPEGVLHRLENKDTSYAEKTYNECLSLEIDMIIPSDGEYPERLKLIDDYPSVIYKIGGDLPKQDDFCCGVVGTRRMSEYGGRMAYSMSYDMAKAGAVIISGLADGVDGVSHRACLDAGGYTVAVLGCGLDICYPADHRGLFDEIKNTGCIISEYPPHTRPDRFRFPMRNRIISGLCQALLVIEAPEKSGALNTASHALKQHRALYALPGKAGELSNEGTNGLITDGAKGVTGGDEIIADFEERYSVSREKIPSLKVIPRFVLTKTGAVMPNEKTEKPEKPEDGPKPAVEEKPQPEKITLEKAQSVLDGEEGVNREILSLLLCGRAMNVDEIVSRTDIDTGDALTALTLLEISGKITLLPGDRYIISEN